MRRSIISYTHGNVQREHSVSAQFILLEELEADTTYDVSVVLEYQHGQRSSPQSVSFVTLARGPGGRLKIVISLLS